MMLMPVLPAAFALASLVVVWACSLSARPDIAARSLAVTLGLVSAAVVLAVSLVAVAWMIPVEHALWCQRMLGHSADHRPVAGATLLGLVIAVGVRSGVVASRIRRIWLAESLGRSTVDIEESAAAYAFAVPGRNRHSRGGHIVVSTGMLAALTCDEQRALFAHESAHLRLAHHRYLLFGRTVEGLLPPLRPLVRRLLWTIERWADEVAAQELGDRGLMASALGKAALAATDHNEAAFLGLRSDSLLGRVEALLQPATSGAARRRLPLGCAVSTAAVSAMTQLHHLVGAVQQISH